MAKKLDITAPAFNGDEAAREHVENVLWPNGPVCPREVCGASGDRITKLMGKSTRPGVYKCKDCRKPFSVTVGTVMERSKIPLSKWVLAVQLIVSSKKGMNAKQLERMLGTNYETAWFLSHRPRECTTVSTSDKFGSIGGENDAERGRVLKRAAEIIRERNCELSTLETLDTGKPLQETLVADALSGAACLDYFGGIAGTIAGQNIDLGRDFVYTRREPLGVCLGIGAWNYPTRSSVGRPRPPSFAATP